MLHKLINLVPLFILEHFGKHLGRRDVGIKFFSIVFDRCTQILPKIIKFSFTYPKNHAPASFAVFEFNVVVDKHFAALECGLHGSGLDEGLLFVTVLRKVVQ